MTDETKPDETKPEEPKQEGPAIKTSAFYIEARDAATGEPIVLEAPPKITYVIRDLKATIDRYGDAFTKQIIKVCGYFPKPIPEEKRVVLQRVEIAVGQPQAVIKQLQDMCMDKRELSNHILHVLGQMARNSGLKAVSITYLVEEPDGEILTGGNSMLFVERPDIAPGELSQLYNSIKSHAEQLREEMEHDGFKIEDQDGPRLFKPGDAGFVIPPKKKR
jgi:hypothetical protein